MPDAVARSVFPRILKSLMAANDMSQVDLGRHLCVSKQTVSDWINGKKFPRVDKMQEMANLFGVRLSDMYNPAFEDANTLHESSLDQDEIRLLILWRGANAQAKTDAIDILSKHQKKDMSLKAE